MTSSSNSGEKFVLSEKTLPEPKIGTQADIDRFKEQCLSMAPDWKLELDKSHKGGVKVWRRTVDFSPIDTVRVWCRFKDLNAANLYDVLHDDVYRTLWDESMIEGIFTFCFVRFLWVAQQKRFFLSFFVLKK